MAKVKWVRRRKNARRGGLAGLLLLFVLALYMPALWKWFFTPGVESGIIQEDTLEMKVPVTGVFIRNEQILRAPESGTILPKARYGERLPTGGVIASFVDRESEDMVSQFNRAETDVLLRVVEAAKEEGDAEAAVIGETVGQEATRLAQAANSGDIGQTAAIRESISRVVAERARDLVLRDTKNGYLTEEKMELQKLESRLGKALVPLTAVQPGIVCYSMDGYEDTWTPERLGSLTVGAIDLQPLDESGEYRWVTPEELPIKKDEAFGKLVQNDACWFAFKVDVKTLKTLSIRLEAAKLDKWETVVDMELDGVTARIPLRLESVQGDVDGKAPGLVVGRMNRFIEQTMEMRKVSGELVLQSLKGMKVPQKALFNRNSVDGTADIMLYRMNRAALRRVRILGIQDAWAVIENLSQAKSGERVGVYDLYLQNPDGMMDGQVVQK